MPDKVFISYSQGDERISESLCKMIERSGVHCWIAPRNIPPGKNWAGAIMDAIDEAAIMVLVFSCHSNDSPHVLRELQRAVDTRTPIIPFRIDRTNPTSDVAYFIGSRQWLDATEPPPERHADRLVDAVRHLLQRRDQSSGEGEGTSVEARRSADFGPKQLESWHAALLSGEWQTVIDCRDEVLLGDLRTLIGSALGEHGVIRESISSANVALMELCRNVARHSSHPAGRIDISLSFKFNRFSLTVFSKGPPFTLEQALAKCAENRHAQGRDHGLRNLLSRGHLTVTSNGGINKVRFDCVLLQGERRTTEFLPLELASAVIVVGERKYGYVEWLHAAGDSTKFNSVSGCAYSIDAGVMLKEYLLGLWRGPSPAKLRLDIAEPDWTLSALEISAILAFRSFVSDIQSDGRFCILGA